MAERAIDWLEQATLYRLFEAGQIGYTVHSASLQDLVVMAAQGHEGTVDELLIVTHNGLRYTGGEIRGLAMRADRPRWTPDS